MRSVDAVANPNDPARPAGGVSYRLRRQRRPREREERSTDGRTNGWMDGWTAAVVEARCPVVDEGRGKRRTGKCGTGN